MDPAAFLNCQLNSAVSVSGPVSAARSPRTAAARATALTARRARFKDFFRLTFGTRDLNARRLIDDFHRQPRLAAIIKAHELDVDFLAFLDDVADAGGAALRKL